MTEPAKTVTGVRVAVDNAAYRFDTLYDYAVPEAFSQKAVAGARVVVPFGKANAPRLGVILEEGVIAPDAKSLLYAEESPILDAEAVELVFTLKDFTFCTYFDAVKTILPRACRVTPVCENGEYLFGDLFEGHTELAYSAQKTDIVPTARQREVLEALGERALTFAELGEATGVTRGTLDRMEEKGLLKRERRLKTASAYKKYTRSPLPELTSEQQRVFCELRDMISAQKKQRALLHGVTASGKTLVYIKLIEYVTSLKKSAIVLVPEIAIATQMIYRLKSLFGERVAIIHSALSDTERQLQWLAVKNGECDIVVGTRSAVFAPVKSLGLIIVDEEQEAAYCSEQSPRYNAAAIARTRAARNGAFLLLGTATPSVETYCRALEGQLELLELRERYLGVPLPSVTVVDMQSELMQGNSGAVSAFLKERIDDRLKKGEQTLLLLNRRGYRTVMTCTQCKKVLKCDNCDVPLVLHKQSDRFLCHYCGSSIPAGDKCPYCGGALRFTGVGTQKIEEELSALFPKADVLRLDVDSTGGRDSFERYLGEIGRGEHDIIIGTQMIAKGLDFPNVTLVGVLSLDSMLLMPSYRAYERTFSMLTQVVGRSGRGGTLGEAVIQTLDPENPIMKFAREQDYRSFYNDEIALRKANLYPPFCALCEVGFVSERSEDAENAANTFVRLLAEAQRGTKIPLRVLGPAPFRVPLVNKLYRYRITLKCRGDAAFRQLLRGVADSFCRDRASSKARFFVDFSPDGDI